MAQLFLQNGIIIVSVSNSQEHSSAWQVSGPEFDSQDQKTQTEANKTKKPQFVIVFTCLYFDNHMVKMEFENL